MIRLNEFKLDKDLDSNQIYLNLKKDIDEYCAQPKHIEYLGELSKILKIPENILNLKFKRLVYNDFNIDKANFNSFNFNFLKLLKNFLFSLIFTIFILVFGKKKFTQKKFDLILDEVDAIRQFKKFYKIIKKFKNPVIFTKKKSIHDEVSSQNIKSIRYNRIIPSKTLINKNFITLMKFFIKIFLKNLKIKENYFIFYFQILLSAIKGETLFSNAISKVVLQDRFYINCPIKNFFFKKHGGKKIISCQYHIAESGISFYTDIDILFTLGNEKQSEKKLRIFGSRIDSSYPVGSIQTEREYHIENKDVVKTNEIDLLVIGIRPPHRHMSNKITNGYYKYLKWLRDFSDANPSIKITYKHHAVFPGDRRESKIFEGSKVKILNKGNSYSYFKKSKVVIAYASTMILEGLSLKKKCFFVNPDDSGSAYFSYHDYDRYFYIKSYQEFCDKVLSSIKSPEQSRDDLNRMCLDSSNVSENIYRKLINQ